jgi:hypothetical protein
MPQVANLALAPSFLELVVTQVLATRDLRLGIIPAYNYVDPNAYIANPSSMFAAEYGVAQNWTRPTIQIPGLGAYDTDRWKLPEVMQWTVTLPENLDVRNFFVVLGGSPSTGDSSGTLIGLATLPQTVTITSGVPTAIKAPWALLGVV